MWQVYLSDIASIVNLQHIDYKTIGNFRPLHNLHIALTFKGLFNVSIT